MCAAACACVRQRPVGTLPTAAGSGSLTDLSSQVPAGLTNRFADSAARVVRPVALLSTAGRISTSVPYSYEKPARRAREQTVRKGEAFEALRMRVHRRRRTHHGWHPWSNEHQQDAGGDGE